MTPSIIHRAGWVMATPHQILENGYIKTVGDRIIETGQGRPTDCGQVVDHGSGVLMAAVVNAHTHLELTSLKGRLPLSQGFQAWVQALIDLRAALSDDKLYQGVQSGIAAMIESGCTAAGEISSLGLSHDLFMNSALTGVWFYEFLGCHIDQRAFPKLRPAGDDVSGVAVAGHAPHTTSPTLLKKLKKLSRMNGCVFSIHIAESEDEIVFLQTGQGAWAQFLKSRGIDFSDWGVPYRSPLHYIDHLGLVDDRTILVHLLRESDAAFQRIAEQGAWVCLCPRSNQNLHQRLPNVDAMRRAGVRLCLGTDSLASTDSLNLFDEMAFLAHAAPSVPPRSIWEMASFNGARALGVGQYCGSLEPGKQNRMLYADLNATNQNQLLEIIVNQEFEALETISER